MSESIDTGTQHAEDVAIPADTTPTTSETAEVKTTAAPEEAATTQPDEPKKRPWFEKVIADKSFEAREYKRQNDDLRARLQAQQPAQQEHQQQQPTGMVREADVERLVEQRATAREFNDACNSTYDAGVSKYADFDEAVKTYSLLGGPPPAFLEAVTSLGKDDGAKVFYDLGKDPDEAARIMALPPVKMAMALAKMASAASKAIPVSKVPDPIRPVQGSNTRSDSEPDAKNNADWIKWFKAKR